MKPPLKKRVPKPRNPFVMLAKQRHAGSHVKPAKVLRNAGKRHLKQQLADLD